MKWFSFKKRKPSQHSQNSAKPAPSGHSHEQPRTQEADYPHSYILDLPAGQWTQAATPSPNTTPISLAQIPALDARVDKENTLIAIPDPDTAASGIQHPEPGEDYEDFLAEVEPIANTWEMSVTTNISDRYRVTALFGESYVLYGQIVRAFKRNSALFLILEEPRGMVCISPAPSSHASKPAQLVSKTVVALGYVRVSKKSSKRYLLVKDQSHYTII